MCRVVLPLLSAGKSEPCRANRAREGRRRSIWAIPPGNSPSRILIHPPGKRRLTTARGRKPASRTVSTISTPIRMSLRTKPSRAQFGTENTFQSKLNTPAKGVQMSRPLCSYPLAPKYNGKGNANAAENFACAAEAKKHERFSSAYIAASHATAIGHHIQLRCRAKSNSIP